jgi:hypothetical protein
MTVNPFPYLVRLSIRGFGLTTDEYQGPLLPPDYAQIVQEGPIQQTQQLGGMQLVLDQDVNEVRQLIQQPQQPGGIRLLLDRNMNEVRQHTRRRYAADERAEVSRKRGLVCEKYRKTSVGYGYLFMLTAIALLTYLVHSCVYQCQPWGRTLGGLGIARMPLFSPLPLIFGVPRCSWVSR